MVIYVENLRNFLFAIGHIGSRTAANFYQNFQMTKRQNSRQPYTN